MTATVSPIMGITGLTMAAVSSMVVDITAVTTSTGVGLGTEDFMEGDVFTEVVPMGMVWTLYRGLVTAAIIRTVELVGAGGGETAGSR